MSWLSGKELETLILRHADDNTLKAFAGIFSIDTLPQQISTLPFMMVINTQTLNLPGEHWKAIYISKERVGEVFDSLALPVSTCLMQWMNRFTRTWYQSYLTIQNPISGTCGAFVLYYILNCLRQPQLRPKRLRTFLELFTKKLYLNDKIVKEYVEQLKRK